MRAVPVGFALRVDVAFLDRGVRVDPGHQLAHPFLPGASRPRGLLAGLRGLAISPRLEFVEILTRRKVHRVGVTPSLDTFVAVGVSGVPFPFDGIDRGL
ncbi:hypothetical protein [Nocardia sp. NPDC005366]|uniref:hypothetical protein n=1 Tax=Nocardia sp. NPDC005366 TaxID=3156878 RepID=UPI0033AB85C2